MVNRILVAAAAFGASWSATGNMVFSQGQEPPQLPAIEAVLTKADGKAVDFAAQALAMQKMVEESQRKGRESLAAQKADYEKQLTEQATANRALADRNTQISKEITGVRAANEDLKTETAKMQAGNMHMRKILQQISEKVDAANLFVTDSLKLTDDSTAEVLKVLVPTTPRPTLNRFLEQAGASLLQISKPSHSSSSTPEDLVQVLSHSLGDIAEAQKEGAAELKAHFLSSFEQGRLKQQDLLAQQHSLNTTLSEQLVYQKDLEAAKTHLASTRDSLKQRLHGLRIFARKLDQTAHDVLASEEVKPTPVAAQAPLPAKTAVREVRTTAAQTTTTTTSTSTATTMMLIAKPVTNPVVEKEKNNHPPKDIRRVKVENVKVASLVEASSANTAKKVTVDKPVAAKELKTEPTKEKGSKHAEATQPASNTTKTPQKTKESKAEAKEAQQTQSPSRLQSWFAAWR